ncbi:MAG: nitroreductase family protein [Syntrophobacteraceae bacterium]
MPLTLLEIDRSKCRKDGICSAVCPRGLISLKEFPETCDEGYELCLACGHCVAACPHGALSNNKLPQGAPFPIRKELQPDADSVVQFLRSRRSIRAFKEKAVPRDTTEKILDCARWAPSASNSQPVSWIAVEKPELMKQLEELAAQWLKDEMPGYARFFTHVPNQGEIILRGAPNLIVALTAAQYPWGDTDCAIALSYVELAAKANGLGTCWAGLLTRAAQANRTIAESLGVPEGFKVHGALMLGYPLYSYARIPTRNEAKIRWA